MNEDEEVAAPVPMADDGIEWEGGGTTACVCTDGAMTPGVG